MNRAPIWAVLRLALGVCVVRGGPRGDATCASGASCVTFPFCCPPGAPCVAPPAGVCLR